MQVFEAFMSGYNTYVTVHGKTYFNARPLNGENHWSFVSSPLEKSSQKRRRRQHNC